MKILKSRTIWTIIIMFFLSGIQVTQPFMDNDVYMLVNTFLTALATYFRVSTNVKF